MSEASSVERLERRCYLVACARKNLNGLNDEEHVQKIGLDHRGMERSVLLLEDDGDDVVANVTLALDLGRVVGREG